MFNKILKIELKKDYIVFCEFNDGSVKKYDFKILDITVGWSPVV